MSTYSSISAVRVNRKSLSDCAPSSNAQLMQTCMGVVVGSSEKMLIVKTGDLVLSGLISISCLLEPEIGDTVACLLDSSSGELWITTILQRESGAPNRIRSEVPLYFAAPEISLSSEKFAMAAGCAELMVDETNFVGKNVRVVAQGIKLIGVVFDSVLDRVTHFSKHYLRTTQGTDRVQADHVDLEAKQLLRVSGEHALINGEKLIKARGGQIHFG